jgi:hypothetical protein
MAFQDSQHFARRARFELYLMDGAGGVLWSVVLRATHQYGYAAKSIYPGHKLGVVQWQDFRLSLVATVLLHFRVHVHGQSKDLPRKGSTRCSLYP